MSKKKSDCGVIFDMDGVLVDTLKHVHTVFNQILKPHDLTVAKLHERHGRLFGGHSTEYILKVLAEHHGVIFARNEFEAECDKIFFPLIESERVTTEPALLKFLDQLKSDNVPVSVVSNSPHARIDRLLKFLSISDYFPITVGTEDAINHKPAPDMFLVAAERMGIAPASCVMIEDMPGNITGAKLAGMKTVGHLAYHSDKTLLNHADLLIHSFSELTPTKIKKLMVQK